MWLSSEVLGQSASPVGGERHCIERKDSFLSSGDEKLHDYHDECSQDQAQAPIGRW